MSRCSLSARILWWTLMSGASQFRLWRNVWVAVKGGKSWAQPESNKVLCEGQVYLGMAVQLRGQQSSNAHPILDCCISAFADMRDGLRIRNGQQERRLASRGST